VKLEGPFVAGQLSQGNHLPGYEHVRWQAVVQKIEPERLQLTGILTASIRRWTTRRDTHAGRVPAAGDPERTLLLLTESGFDKVPAERVRKRSV